jgi:hypothetical protein
MIFVDYVILSVTFLILYDYYFVGLIYNYYEVVFIVLNFFTTFVKILKSILCRITRNSNLYNAAGFMSTIKNNSKQLKIKLNEIE